MPPLVENLPSTAFTGRHEVSAFLNMRSYDLMKTPQLFLIIIHPDD